MSCVLTIAIPIPEVLNVQGKYAAQVMRQAANYVEKQAALTNGQIIDPQRADVVSCKWECQDVEPPVEPPVEPATRRASA